MRPDELPFILDFSVTEKLETIFKLNRHRDIADKNLKPVLCSRFTNESGVTSDDWYYGICYYPSMDVIFGYVGVDFEFGTIYFSKDILIRHHNQYMYVKYIVSENDSNVSTIYYAFKNIL